MTGQDLIRGALRLLGVVAAGESMSGEDLADGLESLNSMIDSWNTERLIVYTFDHPVFTLVPGKQDYSVGPGGDFDMARPNAMEQAFCRIVVNTSTPMDVPIDVVDDATWGNLPLKSISGPYPYMVHNHGEFPVTTFSFFPVPSVANQFIPYVWNKLSRITDPSVDLVFPDGYERALRYNLAIELSPEYLNRGESPSAAVVQIAMESKANLKRLNSAPPELEGDPALTDEVPNYASSMANLYAGGRIR